MSEQAKWYVIHTYSGYENKVAQSVEKVVENRKLRDLIPEIKVPMESYSEVDKDGGVKEAERKLFPSYVLVKMVMNDDTWYIVRNITGVTGFVGPGAKPIPLTEAEVEALGVDTKTAAIEVNYKEGDSISVTGGSFEGFTGTVESIDFEEQIVNVIVSMFGRETPVALPLTQVTKLD